MSKEDGGPAFGYVARIRSETRWNTDPTGEFPAQNRGEEQIVEVVGGMTLRDYFAAAALTGHIAHTNILANAMDEEQCRLQWINAAAFSYRCADAMLSERSK